MVQDIIVVGGGVIGSSIAYRLAQAGAKVTIVERGRIGCESSRAGAGMLAPQSEARSPGPFFDLCMDSFRLYRDFASELSELSGIDVEYRDEGALHVFFEDEEKRDSEEWTAWQAGAGLALEALTREDLAALEPAIRRENIGGVFLASEHQIENRKMMEALAVALKRAGVRVVEGEDVREILVEGERAVGVDCDSGRLGAGTIVVASGSWSSSLLARAGVDISIVPARGQMVAVKGREAPIRHVVHSRDCYLVPRLDGRILIGATVEYEGFEKRNTPKGVASLLLSGMGLVPDLESFEVVEMWSGLRPDTPDHLPVLGPAGLANLLLATGHFRNGLLLAPKTAELISRYVIDGSSAAEMEPFSLSRFAVDRNIESLARP
ncbi:MAG TPA: glycine oxidase ThiO [Blastocatellia bacterium]|jgi:glycine oxidase|nr:glycine oxidase ThiO [Blastocatellia bacterium]